MNFEEHDGDDLSYEELETLDEKPFIDIDLQDDLEDEED